ncbi:hypothetical protein QFZ27_005063 [Inquilinus ginsengisoli]|uniref:hypothetical protein n=1 Tax=Inquilinus ginsengisoli TaxID=363840 RepID=UPI003D1FD884
MIRSTVFAFAAGTALVATPGSVHSPSVDGPAAPGAIAASTGPTASNSSPAQPHRSAAAALGVAVGSVAVAMRYQ